MTRAVVVGAFVALGGAVVALVFLPSRPVDRRGRDGELNDLVVATAQSLPTTATPRVAVLAATVELLKEAGFSSLSFHAVATRSGVSTSTLERTWSSKLDLVMAVVERMSEQMPDPDCGAVHDDCVAYLDGLATLFAAPWAPGVIAVLVGESGRHPDLAAQLRRRVVAPHRDALVAALRRGVARGELGPGTDVQTVADMLVGPLYYRLLVTGQVVDPASVPRLVEYALGGAARSATGTVSSD